MQYRGLAVIKRRKSAIDRGGECVRLGDAFAMRAERFCDFRFAASDTTGQSHNVRHVSSRKARQEK